MKPLYTLIVFLFTIQFSIAQNRFLPGKIVTNSNQIKELEIYFEDWSISPNKILVKENNEKYEFNAEQIKSFEIPSLGIKYIGEKITLNYISKIPIDSYAELFSETRHEFLFMKSLVFSKSLELYSIEDMEEKTRFLIKKDNNLIELVNYTFVISKNGILSKKENTEYKTQLLSMFDNEKGSISSMPSYEEVSLVKFVKKYLNEKGEITETINKNITSNTFLKLGFNIGTEGLQNLKYDFPKNNLNLGLSGLYLLPNEHNNRFFMLDYYISPKFDNGNYSENNKANKNTINVYFGRFFGNKNIQGFISAGLSYSVEIVQDQFSLLGYKKLKYPNFNIGPNFGIAYKKTFVLEFSRSLLFLGGSGIKTDPQIHLKYFPVQKLMRK